MASLPLADHVPLGGVRPGPRALEWLADHHATLTRVEDSKGHDKIVMFSEPFHIVITQGEPRQVYLTEHRYRGLPPLAGGKALVEDYQNTEKPGEGRVIFSRNERDAYKNPGTPATKMQPNGRRAAIQQGDEIYLSGAGASPEGHKSLLDRFDLETLRS